jgi:hypothetical protein
MSYHVMGAFRHVIDAEFQKIFQVNFQLVGSKYLLARPAFCARRPPALPKNLEFKPEQSMESIKEEIHPIIFIPELPEAFVATPVCMKKKSKPTQSRYEDIWSEDVHAAFMEGRSTYITDLPLL